MTPDETAAGTADTVSNLTSAFMLDVDTYAFGAEQGFNGIDFYFAGRGGVLGEVPADVVAASLAFFHPETVAAGWEGSASVMSRADAAAAFAGCAPTWADTHLGDDVDWARLGDLAEVVIGAASPAAAPVFAGWRTLPVPHDPKHRAVHQLNALRELRMARHAAAVVASGVDIGDAVRHRTPYMVGIFGWPEQDVPAGVAERWDGAEALTNAATAHDYAVLDEAQGDELVRLCQEASKAVH
jgi:hypothetical protein